MSCGRSKGFDFRFFWYWQHFQLVQKCHPWTATCPTSRAQHELAAREKRSVYSSVSGAEHTGPGREARFGLAACLVLSQRKCPFRALDSSVKHESRRKDRNPLDHWGSEAQAPVWWTGGPFPSVTTAGLRARTLTHLPQFSLSIHIDSLNLHGAHLCFSSSNWDRI